MKKEDYNWNPDSTVKLVFKPQTDWGTHNIPEERWIKPELEYESNGHRVINIQIKLHNSLGEEITFPVSGSLVTREKPLKTEWTYWTLDGRYNILKPDSKWNLRPVKKL